MKPKATAQAARITRIRLESHRSGDVPPYTLDLHRDGRAVLTRWGSAREGTEDRVESGQLDGSRFAALASLLVRQGFFEMQETYADPDLRDGPWASITVTSGQTDKVVFSRADAGPESLQALERAIAAQRQWIRPANPALAPSR